MCSINSLKYEVSKEDKVESLYNEPQYNEALIQRITH